MFFTICSFEKFYFFVSFFHVFFFNFPFSDVFSFPQLATTPSIISQIDIFFLELKSPFGTLKIKLPEIKLHDECNQKTCDSK